MNLMVWSNDPFPFFFHFPRSNSLQTRQLNEIRPQPVGKDEVSTHLSVFTLPQHHLFIKSEVCLLHTLHLELWSFSSWP